ncbi:MAG: B12-binding domain-containing radical SAM protein [Magnetococcales bacterium]|nr:B12-binding domain-containing radical SAM protein [Magnetococcales bacterium]
MTPEEAADRAKMVVTLVRGPIVLSETSINNAATPAIGLAYIAGYARHFGYRPEIIDAIGLGLNQIVPLERYPGYMSHGLTLNELLSRIPKESRVVGINAMFSGEWPLYRDLIDAVRQHCPQAVIVAGGEHITAMAEYSLRDCRSLDLAVLGEGEHLFYEILERVRRKESLLDMPGTALLDEGSRFIQTSSVTRIRDIDNIPWPYWPEGYLQRFWDAERSYGGQYTGRDMPLMISRGCPFQCAFCSNPNMWTTRYTLRDVDEVLEEIHHYIKTWQITSVQLYDLTAIIKKSWVVEFCTKMLEQGIDIKWSIPSGTRCESLDREVLTLLKKTGCDFICLAPESASQVTLDQVRKRVNLDHLNDAILTARDVGMISRLNLIIGFPDESRKEMWRTLLYGLRMAAKGVDEVLVGVFSPYPGSEFFNRLLAKKKIIIDDAYLLRLNALNSAFTDLKPFTVSKHIDRLELGIYRFFFMSMGIVIGYLFHPSRIVRTIRNIYFNNRAETALEQRLRILVRKKQR